MRLLFAGAMALAMLTFFDAARPDTTQTALGSGSIRLTATAIAGPQLPRTPPNVCGGGVLATDDDDDQAQLQEQLAQQQLQQSEQQAEQQNEEAEQQFEQGMQQAQLDEQQANNP